MKSVHILLAVGCLLSAASGQWLEKKLYVADSIAGVSGPTVLCYDATGDRVYVGGNGDGWLVALDAATNKAIARIPAPGSDLRAIAWNPNTNRLYVAGRMRDSLAIVDCATNQLRTFLGTRSSPTAIAVNTSNNRIYIAHASEFDSVVTVLDGVGDSVLGYVTVGRRMYDVEYAAVSNKVYVSVWQPNSAVVAFDGNTNAIIKRFPLGSWPKDHMVYDAGHNCIYLAWNPDSFGVIDCATDSMIVRERVHSGMDAITYNPTANRVYLTCSGADSLVVIDPTNGAVTAWIPTGDWPDKLGCNPTNNKVYVSNYGSRDIRVVDCATNQVVATIPDQVYNEVIIHAAGPNRVYAANSDGNEVTIIDGATNQLVSQVCLSRFEIHDIAYNSVNRKVYVTDGSQANLAVITADSNTVLKVIAVGMRPEALAYNPLRNRLYCADKYDNTVTVIDGTSDTRLATIETEDGPMGLVYVPSSDRVYVACEGDHVQIIDCRADTIIADENVGDDPKYFALDRRDNKVYCLNAASGYVHVFDAAGDSFLYNIHGNTQPAAITWDSLSDKVYTCGWPSWVQAVDCTTDEIVAELAVGSDPYGLCCNPAHGKVYASCFDGNSVSIIDSHADTVRGVVYGAGPMGLMYEAFRDRVYCTQGYDTTCLIIDGAGDTIREVVPAGPDPRYLVQGPRHNRIYVASFSGGVVAVLRDSGGGVEEAPTAERGTPNAGPTIVRRVLNLRSATCNLQSEMVLFDATGRKVLGLRPGLNDISPLAPGVYFLRFRPQPAGCEPEATRKIVIPG